jgi:hypothetical protein
MYMKYLPLHLTRAFARPRFSAGVLVTLALLSAACSNDSASRINAPLAVSGVSNSQSSGPSLGAASNFAVLSAANGGGGAVTCVNTPPPTTIIGDVGSSGVITPDACTITGAQIAPVSASVVAAFDAAYAALASAQCTQTILQPAFTGENLSVNSGVICFPNGVTFTDATLTLTGNGPWLFLVGGSGVGSGALTGTNFNVVMPVGANPCDVTWWVRAGATMTTSHFIGTILAGAAITVTAGGTGTFNGRALAKAAVTITGGTLTGCTGGSLGGGTAKANCNQGVGNGPEGCDPGNSNQGDPSRSNDELGGTPGHPGRKGGNGK